nr:uncharacterized protein LOC106683901 [Halyomorpha halys]
MVLDCQGLILTMKLQVNLNQQVHLHHCIDAYRVLQQYIKDKDIDIILIQEPYLYDSRSGNELACIVYKNNLKLLPLWQFCLGDLAATQLTHMGTQEGQPSTLQRDIRPMTIQTPMTKLKRILGRGETKIQPALDTNVDHDLKAFDGIKHSEIFKALRLIGIEDKYIKIITELYKEMTAYIMTEKKGQSFDIERGVRQGDPLSPILFVLVLEKVFRRFGWEEVGIKINGKWLSNLRFADDIVLFAKGIEQLKEMMKRLLALCEEVGLYPNHQKTKLMTDGVK